MVTAGVGGIGSMRRGDVTLEKLEAEPREARKGLWADPQPVPPWEWRKGSKWANVTGLRGFSD